MIVGEIGFLRTPIRIRIRVGVRVRVHRRAQLRCLHGAVQVMIREHRLLLGCELWCGVQRHEFVTLDSLLDVR